MTISISTFLGFMALLLPLVTASHWSRHHHQEVAHRARGDVDIHKRQYFASVRATYYNVGLGSCGQYNNPNDWVLALNHEQYDSVYHNFYCYRSITIQYGGLTAVAVIVDECMGCPWAGLDLSVGLFGYFAPLGAGVISPSWWFNDDSGGGQTTSTTPSTTWEQPTTTSTPDYPPPQTTSSTPNYTPPPATTSTSVSTPPPTTSTTSTTSSSSSSSTSSTSPTSSNHTSASWTSGQVVPSATAVPVPGLGNPENIFTINQIMVELGTMLFAAEKN